MRDHNYYVYIMTNKKHGVLYIGVTNNLDGRISEHRQKLVKGFTSKYNLTQLVYYEHHSDINEAIAQEKRMKRWHREWKLKLIEKSNPHWHDLWHGLGYQSDSNEIPGLTGVSRPLPLRYSVTDACNARDDSL